MPDPAGEAPRPAAEGSATASTPTPGRSGTLEPDTRAGAAKGPVAPLVVLVSPEAGGLPDDEDPAPLRALLEAEGNTVVSVDPQRAVDVARSRSAEVVLLPCSLLWLEVAALPGAGVGSGAHALPGHKLALLDRLRRSAPDAAVVVVGGSLDQLPRALARGALGTVRRRGDADELRSVLVQVRTRRRLDKDRLDALEDARRMRKFFEDVLRGLGEGIVVIDEQAHIRYRNPEAARILGEDDSTPERGEIQSGSLNLQQTVLAPLLQLLVGTLTDREPKTKMVAFEEDDRKLFLDVTTSVLRSGDGRTTGAVAVVRDRSSEKLLEEQLAHTERLATLGSLLAAIAHEIANPLSVITGCAEIGQETAREAAEAAQATEEASARQALERLSRDVKDILDQVRDAGLRCQTIANNLLQYSRRTPARVVEQDLNELVKKTLSFVGKYLGTDKVDVVLDFDPKLPLVKVDAAQLQQALTNLIDNAVHAMIGQRKAMTRSTPVPTGQQSAPSSGQIPLRAPKLSITTRVEASTATILVADNGPGIPPRQLERIWRPFYTTKERGTGLGLYITRRAIEHQGGTIALQTKVGEGTTFTIKLPL